ncbi:inner membrane transporter RhtA [Phycicoccus badiiscoriae]|uniref:Inner membrane transporter RhtA n=1 Tax=Pedococcus badiiscoriae TaxID=642776 RepID=A0A852WGM5_9MICO|nr:EamA family transporter [Pedococcus badiiscoriae]NYG08367.1 inner membrane transporter RhtA [Pedococcus badiiscoriae]
MVAKRTPARPLLLVLTAIISVQFGGALAATLVPQIGAGGSVTLRLLFATGILWAIARPRVRGHSRAAWLTVLAFGCALGLMNLAFYASLAHLHIGVAVTVEFLGPLTLATVLSRRPRDLAAVGAAAVGVLLISQALNTPLAHLEWTGLGLAALAGACWAAYILASGRAGREFPQLEGLALAMAVAFVVTLPFGVSSAPSWSTESVAKGLGIAVLSSVLPYSLELAALRHLSPGVFGILLSLEPAAAALAGLVVLGQRLTPLQLTGMGLVVLASTLVMGAGQPKDPAASGG